MQFTGRNLDLVRNALRLADVELHNLIATCPDVNEYAEDIVELEQEQVDLRRLLARVNNVLEKQS